MGIHDPSDKGTPKNQSDKEGKLSGSLHDKFILTMVKKKSMSSSTINGGVINSYDIDLWHTPQYFVVFCGQ